jgi:hypothetical protein
LQRVHKIKYRKLIKVVTFEGTDVEMIR